MFFTLTFYLSLSIFQIFSTIVYINSYRRFLLQVIKVIGIKSSKGVLYIVRVHQTRFKRFTVRASAPFYFYLFSISITRLYIPINLSFNNILKDCLDLMLEYQSLLKLLLLLNIPFSTQVTRMVSFYIASYIINQIKEEVGLIYTFMQVRVYNTTSLICKPF